MFAQKFSRNKVESASPLSAVHPPCPLYPHRVLFPFAQKETPHIFGSLYVSIFYSLSVSTVDRKSFFPLILLPFFFCPGVFHLPNRVAPPTRTKPPEKTPPPTSKLSTHPPSCVFITGSVHEKVSAFITEF